MIIKVNDSNGNFIGLTKIKSTDICKACGGLFTLHGTFAWVNADNGNHITCNLKEGK